MASLGKTPLQAMLKTVLLTSLVLTVPIVAGRFFGWFEQSELAAYDDFMQQRPAEKPDDRIVIVTIGDDDIEQLQQYPLHDVTFATALETLERYQPRAIGLDISRDVPQGPLAGRKQLTQLINASEVIVSGCLLSTENHPGSPPAPGTPEGGAAFADLPPDRDQVIRRVRLVSTPGKSAKATRTRHICNNASTENEIPSLSFLLAQLYLERSGIAPEPDANGDIQFGKQVLQRLDARFGSYAPAEMDAYQIMLNYQGAQSLFRQVSIVDVLQNKVNPASIRDRVVLIGSSSEVSKDFLATPYVKTQLGSRTMLGVEVHAQAVSQLLSAVLDQRLLIRSWSESSEVLWIWVWSLGSGLLAFYNRRLGLFLLLLGGTVIALWGICYGLFLYQGLWIPFIPTLLAALLTALSVRLVDLAHRTGYAQAIYEQVREQMQGNGVGRDRQGDYLAQLVQRAQAARQGHDAANLLSLGAQPTTFATPQMKALYDQIVAKVRTDVASEQASQPVAIPLARGSKASRMQTLLHRAQQSRHPRELNQPDSAQAPIHPVEKPRG
ncbi:MAG: CHASE2 domain-containing protein [Stenomitos frigidus ULC029]